MRPEFSTFKGYINFLLLDMADSPSSDIDSSLPDIDVLLRPRFRHAVPTASSAAHFDTPIRKPGDRQSNPIEILDALPPAQTVLNEALQASPWIGRPWSIERTRRPQENYPVQDEYLVQEALQESSPPLPPPGTSPPTGRECRRAASIQPTEDHNAPWLRSPSPEVEIERPEWKPNPQLHPDLVVVKKVVDSMPAHHLLPPKTGEEFDSIEAAFNRLQDYAFTKGFLIVKYSGNPIGTERPRQIFACKHHSEHTQNNRNLDDFTGEGSNRQRQYTTTSQRGCPYRLRVSWVCRKGSIQSGMLWRLTVSNPLHGKSPLEEHPFVANPLAFTAHEDRLPDAQEACARAYALRATKESTYAGVLAAFLLETVAKIMPWVRSNYSCRSTVLTTALDIHTQ